MFDSLFGGGDAPLMDSILHLSPLFDLPSSSGRTAAEEYLLAFGSGLLPHEREFLEIMSMSAMGRNAPCPCGSVKKHKKCCLGKMH